MSADAVTTWTTRDRLLFGVLPPAFLFLASLLEHLSPYSEPVAGWPFALSLLFVGLPHGAVDLAITSQLYRTTNWLSALQMFSGYLAWLLVGLGVTLLTPLGSILIFALFSAWHFGAADTRDLNEYTGGGHPSPIIIAARGMLVLALPFAFHPAASGRVVDQLLVLLGSNPVGPMPSPVPDLAAGIVASALLLMGSDVAGRVRRRQYRAATLEMLEIAAIVLAFGTLHPLFAMGLYFLVWHSWRHTRRVIGLLEGTRSVSLAALARMHLRSLPLLVPTVLAVMALLGWRAQALTSLDLALVSLAVFLVVTPAHHFLVERLHGWNPGEARSAPAAAIQPTKHIEDMRRVRLGTQRGYHGS